MADKHEQPESESEAADQKSSIFDLFEPPPERDPNSFGKIPVIKDDEIDLTDGGSAAEVKAAQDAEAAGLQHWTAPPTGQVPAVLGSDRDERGLWADVKGPSWHGDDPSWAGPDLADVFADTDSVNLGADEFADDHDDYEDDYDDGDELYQEVALQRPVRATGAPSDETEIGPPPVGAPRTSTPDPGPGPVSAPPRSASRPPIPRPDTPAPGPDRPTVADGPASSPVRPAATPPERKPTAPRPQRTPAQPAAAEASPRPVPAPETHRFAPGSNGQPPPLQESPRRTLGVSEQAPQLDRPERAMAAAAPETRLERPAPLERPAQAPPPPRQRLEPNIDDIEFADDEYYEEELDEDDGLGYGPDGGRNIPQAIGVGLALAAVVLAAMFFGPETTLALVVILALLAVLELYNAMRMAGLRPATLLGIVGTVAAPAAAFYRGDAAFPLIVALTVVFGTLWYLVGADTERPVLNLSLTMMGIFWVGGLAAFGALMISNDGGIELLLATIIITVASDTMAYIGGRAYGSRPFHHASPNKTWEGTITGFAGALFAGFAIGVTEMGTLWDTNLVPAIVLGAVVGCLAPMGDLAESVVKRDLGVKDMGTLLPGHGGVLDRLDGLLFALPGAYYLALVYGLI